jgi:hypothetical protein
VIVQNADEIYWDLLKKGRQDAEAVRIAAGSYCVFTASPMLKYQAYLRIIDQWSEGAECDIHTPTMEEMYENLLNFLVGGSGRLGVTMGEDWREPVESVVPEVNCGTTYKAISSRLRSMGMTQRGVLAASESLRRSGMVYIPLVNDLEIQRFDPVCAAREAARFVIYAMREEIGPGRKIRRTMEDRFYSFVFEEALCAFGARIVDPVTGCGGPGPLLESMRGGGPVSEPLPGMTLADTGKTVSLLRYHIAWERSGENVVTGRMRGLYRLGIRKRLWVIRALGRPLGEAMYRGFHEGRVSLEELRGLFRERFDRKGSAMPLYLEWVRRLQP